MIYSLCDEVILILMLLRWTLKFFVVFELHTRNGAEFLDIAVPVKEKLIHKKSDNLAMGSGALSSRSGEAFFNEV